MISANGKDVIVVYNADTWYIFPAWFIPASLLWAGIELFCEERHIIVKLQEKYPKYRYRIKKWLHICAGIISYIVTLPLAWLLLELFPFLQGGK